MRNLNKPLVKAALLPLLLSLAVEAQGADKELLDILLGNGAITRQQYDALLAKEELEKADVAKLSFGNGSGLSVSSGDGSYEVEIGGRLHMDYVDHSYDSRMGVAPVSGTQIRRGRVEFDGVFNDNWGWAAELDFAKNTVAIKDFKLGYETEGGATFYIGHQKQPYSLSLEMSSNDEPFVERSVDNALVATLTDRALGFRTEASGAKWFVAAGLFGDTLNTGGNGDEGWGTAARVVYAPVLDDEHVVHLGLRHAYRAIEPATPTFSIKDKTTDFSALSIVNTGAIANADAVTLFGPELALAFGPLYVFAEYTDANISRSNAGDLNFDAWHIGTAWTLTGESRAERYRIDAGEFKNLRPASTFDLRKGDFGAVEIAARYAAINLNDGAFIGGEEEAASLALNWQPNYNVRLMLDWTHIMDTDGSNAIRQFAPDMDILTFRTQYNY
jgi:phosphate-selective porin OprO/OprP